MLPSPKTSPRSFVLFLLNIFIGTTELTLTSINNLVLNMWQLSNDLALLVLPIGAIRITQVYIIVAHPKNNTVG